MQMYIPSSKNKSLLYQFHLLGVQLTVVYSVYINVNWDKPIVTLPRSESKTWAVIYWPTGVQFVLEKWVLYFK